MEIEIPSEIKVNSKKKYNDFLSNYKDDEYENLYNYELIRKMQKMQDENIQKYITNDSISSENLIELNNIPEDRHNLSAEQMLYKVFIHEKGNFLIKSGKNSYKFFNKYFEIIFKLYSIVEDYKGFEETTSADLWDKIQKELEFDEILKEANKENIKQFYEDYLFHFEKFYSKKSYKTDLEGFTKVIENLKPEFMIPVEIFDANQYKITDESFINMIFQKQICILRGFLPKINFNNEKFSNINIAKNHPNDKIDIIRQNPELYGFKIKKERSKQTKNLYSISKYVEYQNKYIPAETHSTSDKDFEIIEFAVNIDIGEWKDELEEIQKLPQQFLYCSKYDCLSYLTQNINGITIPQVYMKVKGAWTGGHEENLRVQALNINHGPSDCEWFTIENKNVRLFRKTVKEIFNLDIHGHGQEGLWFCDIDFCLTFGIPVTKFLQKPGDIVYLNAGCLHWVRSKGMTVNSAWNIATKYSMQDIYERFHINREIGFESIIPLKSMSLDLIHHEYKILNKEFLIKCLQFVKESYEEEEALKKIYNSILHNVKPQLPDSNVLKCSECKTETFNYWCMCETCDNKMKDINEYIIFLCLKCGSKHLKHYHNHYLLVYKKFDNWILKELINKIDKFLQNSNNQKDVHLFCEYPALCKKFIGKTKCIQNLTKSEMENGKNNTIQLEVPIEKKNIKIEKNETINDNEYKIKKKIESKTADNNSNLDCAYNNSLNFMKIQGGLGSLLQNSKK